MKLFCNFYYNFSHKWCNLLKTDYATNLMPGWDHFLPSINQKSTIYCIKNLISGWKQNTQSIWVFGLRLRAKGFVIAIHLCIVGLSSGESNSILHCSVTTDTSRRWVGFSCNNGLPAHLHKSIMSHINYSLLSDQYQTL